MILQRHQWRAMSCHLRKGLRYSWGKPLAQSYHLQDTHANTGRRPSHCPFLLVCASRSRTGHVCTLDTSRVRMYHRPGSQTSTSNWRWPWHSLPVYACHVGTLPVCTQGTWRSVWAERLHPHSLPSICIVRTRLRWALQMVRHEDR